MTLPPILLRLMVMSFNSLQTGKWSQRAVKPGIIDLVEGGFNSLQTGKWSQRDNVEKFVCFDGDSCFNSLQTGKWIQSHARALPWPIPLCVSIPFKRESVFRASPHKYLDISFILVSIPFKRETTGGLVISRPSFTETFFSDNWQLETDNYSPIPFKRESGFRAYLKPIEVVVS